MIERAGGLIVAVDGPAASGKSTVAISLARRLDMMLVDSGSMYRAVALLATERHAGAKEEVKIGEIACAVREGYRSILPEEGQLRVFLGDREVTEAIRSTEATGAVSEVSRIAVVREEMVRLQRSIVEGERAVIEGRDIGTTVFPDANLKVFLDAEVEERARRRYLEYKEKGIDATASDVFRQIRKRDEVDSSRDLSPLAISEGALIIDTTLKTVETVVKEIIEELKGA